jgi:hypothetical protein
MSTVENQVLQELENGGHRYESTKVKCQVLQPLICNEHCYDSDFPNTLLISQSYICISGSTNGDMCACLAYNEIWRASGQSL